MKIQTQLFKSLIDKVAWCVNPRSFDEAARNILIDVKGGRISLMATDLIVFVEAFAEVDGEDTIRCCVGADKLKDIIGAIPAMALDITLVDGKLLMKGGKTKRQIATIAANDFPQFPDKPEGALSNITGIYSLMSNLAPLLKDSNHISQAMYFKDNVLSAASGPAMAAYTLEEKFDGHMSLPAKTVKHIASRKQDFKFSFNEAIAYFEFTDMHMYSMLIDGHEVNIQGLFEGEPNEVKVKKDDLLISLKSLLPITDKDLAPVSVSVKGKKMKLSATLSGFGMDGEEEIKCEGGNDMEFRMSASQLIEAVSILEGETVTIGYGLKAIPQKEGAKVPTLVVIKENNLVYYIVTLSEVI